MCTFLNFFFLLQLLALIILLHYCISILLLFLKFKLLSATTLLPLWLSRFLQLP